MNVPGDRAGDRVGLLLSHDPALVDLDVVHGFLSTCYWSPGIVRSRVERAIKNSIVFGVYDLTKPRGGVRVAGAAEGTQVAFARVVTDKASFAYLCDVFVLEAYRGRGIGAWLMEGVLAHPELQGLRRFSLMTRDAHGLYEKFGFGPTKNPLAYMERVDRESYKRAEG